ncbi:MAG: hypothetical protein ACXWYS_02265 [Gaiellaceae bacterium]
MRVIAAVVCAAATLTGTTTPASAADGLIPGTVGGAPIAEPAAATPAAAAIVDTAIQVASTASTAPAAPSTPSPEAADGQYQPSDGQYQDETGQYQGPAASPVTATATPPGDVAKAAADVAAAAAAPTNINVSVRVLSPGDDGPVAQVTGGTQPIGSAPGAPIAATPTQVLISVNVNITANWNIVFSPPVMDGQYHSPEKQYQSPPAIDAGTSVAATPSSSPGAPAAQATPPPVSVSEPPVATAQPARARASAAPTSRRERGTGGATRRALPVVQAPVVVAPATATAAPIGAPSSYATAAARRPARPSARHATAQPVRPPALPWPIVPEQFGGAGASGGFGAASVLQSLAILVASLCFAWLGSASRLGAGVQPQGDAPSPRRRKPG